MGAAERQPRRYRFCGSDLAFASKPLKKKKKERNQLPLTLFSRQPTRKGFMGCLHIVIVTTVLGAVLPVFWCLCGHRVLAEQAFLISASIYAEPCTLSQVTHGKQTNEWNDLFRVTQLESGSRECPVPLTASPHLYLICHSALHVDIQAQALMSCFLHSIFSVL